MFQKQRFIFIHGLEGSSQGVKARLLRSMYPDILTPDFRGSIAERMTFLQGVLADNVGWTIVGSSYGGLMATLFACQHPEQISKLILLAPALVLLTDEDYPVQPLSIPVIIYHGRQDQIIPLEQTRFLAEKLFSNLVFHQVDDDHGLYQTVHEIKWQKLLETE